MTHFKNVLSPHCIWREKPGLYKNQACQSLKDIEEILKKVMHRWIL